MSEAATGAADPQRAAAANPRRGEGAASGLRRAIDALLAAPLEGDARWLRGFAFQAELVAARDAALIELGSGAEARVLAFWPHAGPPVWLERAVAIAERGFAEEQAEPPRELYRVECGEKSSPITLFVQPLLAHQGGRRRRLAAAYAVPTPTPFVAALAGERLELARGLLERPGPAPASELEAVVEILAAMGSCQRFEVLAGVFCSELANRFAASRVALALARDDDVRIVARNHRASSEVRLDEVGDLVERARVVVASDLERTSDAGDGVSLPIRRGARACGALLLDRPGRPFGEREIETLRLATDLATPRLLERERSDRPLRHRLGDAVLGARTALLEPRHAARKLAFAAVALFGVFAVLGEGTLWVEAPFIIEPAHSRIVSAPFDGTLASSTLEPGDEVTGGESVLAELETDELGLELLRARADVLQALKEADVARTAGSPAGEQVARYAAQRARAAVTLLEARLADARIVAPVSGVVLEGDLRKRLGGPVSRGEVLARLAPLDALRAELAVSEERIADIAPGQTGVLRPASEPGRRIPVEVVRIDPQAQAAAGRNAFRVVAVVRPEPGGAPLLPGVAGVARIAAGEGRYLWLWTRSFVRALRLTLWI